MSVESNITKLTEEHASLVTEREQIETKVVMLRPGTINRDLLEERARAVLGYRHPDEVTIIAN